MNTNPKNELEQLTDYQAWEMLKSGDVKGLEKLYRIYSAELFRFGMSLAHEEPFVLDSIQELFLDLWKYQNNLSEVGNLKLYLFKSLSNKIKRAKKTQSKQAKIEFSGMEDLVSTGSVEDEWISSQQEEELKKRLAKGIENLPLRQKEVIQYLFFERMSYEECSKILEINLRSVYTLAWKAINSLKKHLGFF
ncbi:RNA polymerase sigma factor [Cecembia rubra]|uniref:RNA polymerase sigma factor (Sigma-70 family) n=1 Tax=Cecembia rubra TaxID=1485585 RepID=A0A2P8EAM6_9BACT|nr:sigma-70 family RNA polymerase sigma factor [Cecembia rubra]PSL06521.1 RNA polymerase sigma factor (sigma-70 family) [Cecembia rubra]